MHPPDDDLELYTPFHKVWLSAAPRLVMAWRSAESYASIAELRDEMQLFRNAMQRLRLQCPRALIDVRDAVGRNDPEFEKIFLPLRDDALRGYERVALLATTQAGAMQLERHRGGKDHLAICQDRQQAIHWLLEPAALRRR